MIQDYLKIPCDIIKFDTVASTNDVAKEKTAESDADFTVIIAEKQTAGKGRLSRKFYSPEGSGIYMSIILRPKISVCDTPLITTAAAVAVSRAIDNICGISPLIKWVNDLYYGGRKICGILTEGAINPQNADLNYAILGIGVNLYENEFPDDIKDIAGCIFSHPTDEETKHRLIAEILNEFFIIYQNLTDRKFMDEYRRRSFILGKKITYEKNGETKSGVAKSIDDDARLTVELDNKTVETLYSGEVSIKLA